MVSNSVSRHALLVSSAASDRLAQLIERADATLDHLCAAISLIDADGWPEDRVVATFDRLASELEGCTTAEDLLGAMFGSLGFGANRSAYYAPENSFIHHALTNRRAIPLTLAVIACELGRRVDVPLTVVGMPGHALIGDGSDPSRWFDPFAAGRQLSANDCKGILNALIPTARFDVEMLAPTPPIDVIARMLQNLRAAFLRAGDLGQLAAVLHVRTALPSSPVEDRVELANVLAALGRDDQASEQRHVLAALQPERADEHLAAAGRHLARRN